MANSKGNPWLAPFHAWLMLTVLLGLGCGGRLEHGDGDALHLPTSETRSSGMGAAVYSESSPGGSSWVSAEGCHMLVIQRGGTKSPEYVEYNGYGGTVGSGLTNVYHDDSSAPRPAKCAGVVCVEPENCVAWAFYSDACCPVCEKVECGDCSVLKCPS